MANGNTLRVELEDGTIRIPYRGIKSDESEIKVSNLVGVSWKEPRLLNGCITFILPAGKLEVTFSRNNRDEFRAVYEALITSLNETRRLGAHLKTLFNPGFTVPLTTPETPDVVVRRNLRLGEIRREFDSQTTGVIEGAMQHELGLHGSFTGIKLGGIGIGSGQLGLSGTTKVNLQTQSTTRSDFRSDRFVAIFDEPSNSPIPETLRVIVPTEEECREVIVDYFSSVLSHMGLEQGLEQRIMSVAEGAIATDISYVSDRLSAVLRMNSEKAPVFNVIGVMSRPHMMLGGAIQMPGDDRWLQLFPVGLLRILSMPLADGGTSEQAVLPQ